MPRKTVTIEAVDAKLKRWKTRFARAVTEIAKLERQRKRLLAKPTPRAPRPWAHADLADLPATLGPAIREAAQEAPKAAEPVRSLQEADKLHIPAFLARGKIDSGDQETISQIKTEQAETKKAKARGRIEKMKAVKRGDTKKMPLTGKAALDHIRNG
jgi:hypothetical protein